MIEFGETLRKTREAKGLTTSEVAKRTHMLVQQVEALEKEDFSKIAAPIYGRGFVKLYCEAVGITDPKPLVDEFMDIYSGNRPPTIRMRQSVPHKEPEVISQSEQAVSKPKSVAPPPINETLVPPLPPAEEKPQDETSTTSGETLFDGVDASDAFSYAEDMDQPQETTDTSVDEFSASDEVPAAETPHVEEEPAKEEPVTTLPPPPNAGSLFDFALESEVVAADNPKPEAVVSDLDDIGESAAEPSPKSIFRRSQGPSKYAAPQPLEYDERPSFRIPPTVWRIGVLIAGAGLLLWLIFAGISCVYNATMSSVESPTEVSQAEEAASAEPDEKQSDSVSAPATVPQKRTPMKLKPLYID